MIAHLTVRRAEAGITVVALGGQLTAGNQLPEIEFKIMELIREGARKMVVDMSELTFIDSAGLGSMITCAGTMKKQGGKLVIVGAAGKVTQMFTLTGLGTLIGVYADLPAAVAACSEPPTPAPAA